VGCNQGQEPSTLTFSINLVSSCVEIDEEACVDCVKVDGESESLPAVSEGAM
jgi:hypothetical protein